MISRDRMFAPMLEACPSFGPLWRDFVEDSRKSAEEIYWKTDELPLYLALDELAVHLIKKIETNDTKNFDAIFDVIERWLLDGDAYVKLATEVGLFERIKHTSGPKSPAWNQFQSWLRPVSRQSWNRA